MKKLLALLVLSSFIAVPLRAGELDGTEWKVKPRGLRGLFTWHADHLKFDNGQVVSLDTSKDGFEPTSYDIRKEGGRTSWTTTQANKNGEKMVWTGVRDGTEMQGTYTWFKSSGDVKSVYWKARLSPAGNN
jgi:hypothetical protein